jgi:AraC-like DNA-binding protein
VEKKMPGSVASVFSEAEDFEAALSEEGCRGVLLTGRGAFQARVTQIGLHRLGLAAVEEQLPRIAFFSIPAVMILAAFALGRTPSPRWGGIAPQAGEIITIAPGERLHSLTDGPALWGAVRIAQGALLNYGRAVAGAGFAIPRGITRWRPSPTVARQLCELHRAAIRTVAKRPESFVDGAAAHGLEQQITDALIECLSPPAQEEEPAAASDRAVLARFEELLLAGPAGTLAKICVEAGVPRRRLRECCIRHLGMSPAEYRRRQAMQQVNRDLRCENVKTSTVAMVAKRHGLKDLSRFAANYRVLYGELPSETLRASYGVVPITLQRRRVKVL